VFFLAGVFCLFFIGIWCYQLLQGKERAITSAKKNTANLVRFVEEANKRTIQAIDILLTNVAISVKPDVWAADHNPNLFLQSLIDEAPQVREIAFADRMGRIIAMSRQDTPHDLSIAHELFFSKARDGLLPELYISSPRKGRLLGEATPDAPITGLWHFLMARAVFDESNQFVGIALAVVNPGVFQEQIHALDIGSKGYVAYYRYDGQLLVASDQKSLHLEDANHAHQALFTDYLPLREWGTFVQQPQVRGDSTYIVSYRATSRWPLLVSVAIDKNEALEPWKHDAWDFSMLMLTSLIILFIFAVMVYRQHVAQEQMAQELMEAHHDKLTSLPALQLCMDRLAIALSRARRDQSLLAVFFIDLDGFKFVNDNHGHQAGDHVLKEVAARLTKNVRQMDTVARLGGDEFLIILPVIRNITIVGKISTKLIKAIQMPIDWKNQNLSVSASIGIALHPAHGTSTEELIKSADKAMYEAKKNGKNQYIIAGNTEQKSD
jgi:diguanylate cyclase (GGDEF)-like protein